MTMTELDSILLSMKDEKSSGVDQIPPEFLKNSGIQFKQYLLSFYNKIIQEGAVPAGRHYIPGTWELVPRQLLSWQAGHLTQNEST